MAERVVRSRPGCLTYCPRSRSRRRMFVLFGTWDRVDRRCIIWTTAAGQHPGPICLIICGLPPARLLVTIGSCSSQPLERLCLDMQTKPAAGCSLINKHACRWLELSGDTAVVRETRRELGRCLTIPSGCCPRPPGSLNLRPWRPGMTSGLDPS